MLSWIECPVVTDAVLMISEGGLERDEHGERDK